MTVLDASAVLALVHDEPGADVVAQALASAHLGAANLAEVIGKLVDADVDVNPSGGALSANPMMVAGLTRLGEAASRILDGTARRAVAHATSGPCLQQNLVCVLEASS